MYHKRKCKINTLRIPLIPTLIFNILLTVQRAEANTVRCPRYCECYLDTIDNLRSVSCIARRLDNIDLSIPRRVQSLDLSNNSISVIEDRGFQSLGLIEIIKLVMKHNSIRTIGLHSFAGMPYLEWVDLTDNNLYQILPWTFHDNTNLKFISLSDNPLGHVMSTGPFLDVPTLEVLELSSCNFAYFSQDAFSALPNLRRLDISHNQLIHFDSYTLQFLYYLEDLDIAKNPWPCNSNLKSLKEFLNNRSGSLTGSTCDIPESQQYIHIEPAKFQKIMSVGTVYDDFSSSDEDDDNTEAKATVKKHCECNCKPENKTTVSYEDNLILPPTLLVLVSFQLGVCTTLFLGYSWILCTKQKSKYQPLVPVVQITPTEIEPTVGIHQETEEQTMQMVTETIECPETPPPSYRDLFMVPAP